ncbi:MAG TPA: hypothetical protein VML55_12330 [Planctomycetaceae bacterium]|nr:hypothetical protein [Planctomycetaceae bacterium]
MSVEQLVEAVKTLSAAERLRLREALDRLLLLDSSSAATDEDAFERELADAGLLSEVKPPISDPAPFRNRPPVPIRGEPLSRTVIEERR